MKTAATILILFCLSTNTYSQVKTTSILFKTLKEKDHLVFDVGFNNCDTSQFKLLMSEDVEFYHDQGGLSVSRSSQLESMKNGLCKNSKNKYRRELVEGSLKVFPLKNNKSLYGAIQNGIHRFYINDNGTKGKFESIARFSHIWMLKNDTWQLTRIFSYNHKGKDYLSDDNNAFKDENEIRQFYRRKRHTRAWDWRH